MSEETCRESARPTGRGQQEQPPCDVAAARDPDDHARRDAWLAAKARDRYKHLVWVGRDVSIADAERWLRQALEVSY